jgi:hypothetical protein
MTEQDSGKGRLVSLEADQTEYFVDYELTVDTQVMGSNERFDPAKDGKALLIADKAQQRRQDSRR